jgi:hypothetical protein
VGKKNWVDQKKRSLAILKQACQQFYFESMKIGRK